MKVHNLPVMEVVMENLAASRSMLSPLSVIDDITLRDTDKKKIKLLISNGFKSHWWLANLF